MTDKKYPPNGRLFSNKKTSENQPDITGDLEIDAEVLAHLNDCARRGVNISMLLAGWRRKLSSGSTFYSIQASKPRYQESAGQTPPDRLKDDLSDELPY